MEDVERRVGLWVSEGGSKMCRFPSGVCVSSSDRWQQVELLYHEALSRDERERATFLRDASLGDEALRREVESLLAYDRDAHGFMSSPALVVMAPASIDLEETVEPLIGQRPGP